MARDVYGLHPDELTDDQRIYCREFIALRLWEMRQEAAAHGDQAQV